MINTKRRRLRPPAAKLPDTTVAALKRSAALPAERTAATLDALLVLVAPDEKPLWNRLPEAQRWRALHARAAPVALKFRSTTLANARASLALLGYVKSNASSFERLSFAGRLVRELAARRPARIGLIVSPALEDCAQWCEALLSAVWSESFALPDFRTRAGDAWAVQAI
ncbi:MAG: hypothetical protein ABSF96_16295, partial [Steroidobacteraceae bacterium]